MVVPNIETNNFKISQYPIKNKIAQFDLGLSCSENNGEILAVFDYCTELFERNTVEKMSENFVKLVEEICKNEKVTIGDISLGKEYCLKSENEELEIEFNF